MKKRISSLLLILSLTACVLSGCSSVEVDATDDKVEKVEETSDGTEEVIVLQQKMTYFAESEAGSFRRAQYTYDSIGNMIKFVEFTGYNSDEGLVENESIVEEYVYDMSGNQILFERYQDGKLSWQAEMEYNNQGKIILKTEYNGDFELYGTKSYEYDEYGNLSKQTDNNIADDRVYTYTYNALGQLVRLDNYNVDNGWTRFDKYEYDEAGNLIKATTYEQYDDGTKASEWIEYKYNESNNLVQEKTWLSESITDSSIDYEYDESGKLLKKLYYSKGSLNMWEEYEYTTLSEFLEDNASATSETVTESVEESQDTVDVEAILEAYRNYVEVVYLNMFDYRLLHLDNDEIPEMLMLDDNGSGYIHTYYNGEVVCYAISAYSTISLERQGLIYAGGGRGGEYNDTVIEFKDGTFTKVFDGWCSDNDAVANKFGIYGGEELSEEDYYRALLAKFPISSYEEHKFDVGGTYYTLDKYFQSYADAYASYTGKVTADYSVPEYLISTFEMSDGKLTVISESTFYGTDTNTICYEVATDCDWYESDVTGARLGNTTYETLKEEIDTTHGYYAEDRENYVIDSAKVVCIKVENGLVVEVYGLIS